ncbi:MAG: helix-turn-helix transcriptional regulator [Proteobacteria bacterium]|nr:helix-turn-helix transcriptional regulator [Pseudomonadota bacterium]MBU1388729.1 helix-turn-helix transcriptional regulator [Pseudomonadota bacterium]MBU1543070.1 helix-turn-helix transcriptional regulator [Pseudomonadota bacterium]MBU2481826.1 helix-turn-helix transcriptional regulator [Pseudomonadota bacterium]
MLEHTKNPHTKVSLLFEGPAEKKDEAIAALKRLGFRTSENGHTPRRTAFAEFKNNEAGTSLAGGRHKEGITQVNLSELTGIPQRHISEMERGKRPIGKKNAKLFATVLKVDYRVFL